MPNYKDHNNRTVGPGLVELKFLEVFAIHTLRKKTRLVLLAQIDNAECTKEQQDTLCSFFLAVDDTRYANEHFPWN